MEFVGRYRTVRRLGEGGMAEVLEAVALGEHGFSRRVAIKRILPIHAADASFARMFIDEARIASRLHHANIAGVLDFGVADGIPFQILEFVDGLDVRTLQKRGDEAGHPMPVEIALHLCTEIAHALHHAHQARDENGQAFGIVHRDVTPSNVLISWDGDVKLTDFGIAVARDRQEKTQAGMAKGKLSYMAPEQAMAGDVDSRTDVFALGCTLHTLLAGRSPLANENSLAELMTGTPLPLDPSVPEDARAIIAKAVQRAKSDRFQSASEMAAALGKALNARIDQDARSVLQEWLFRIRPPSVKTGALDALLDVEFVLQNGGAPDEVRHFQTATRPIAATTAQTVVDGPRRRGAKGWSLVAGVAIAGAATWYAAALVLPVAPPAATPTPAARRATPAEALATALPSVATASATPVSTRVARINPTPLPATTRPRVATPPPVQTPLAPVVMGTVVIGGSGALRAEIFVDGKSRGFAPGTIELPVGRHSLELARPDGSRIGPQQVEITQRHTLIAPYRWILK